MAQAFTALDAPAVARLLLEIGQRLVLAGENPYKARSYTRAAESLLLLSEPLEQVIGAGQLQECGYRRNPSMCTDLKSSPVPI